MTMARAIVFTVALLCGSAAAESGPIRSDIAPELPPPPPKEPERFVQRSLKHRYEDPLSSFLIERFILPESEVAAYRAEHAAPDEVIDSCEYAIEGNVIKIWGCVKE